MCEFCTKHGDGQVWYKNAANYSNDLLSDLRRRAFIADFLEQRSGADLKLLAAWKLSSEKAVCPVYKK
jgi:hypothetical protein